MLMEAAMYAENDKLRGVSENIILGNLAPLGTASFELLLNSEMLKEAIEIPGDTYAGFVPPLFPFFLSFRYSSLIRVTTREVRCLLALQITTTIRT